MLETGTSSEIATAAPEPAVQEDQPQQQSKPVIIPGRRIPIPGPIDRWTRLTHLEELVRKKIDRPDLIARDLLAGEKRTLRERSFRAVDPLTELYAAGTFIGTLEREMEILEREPSRVGLGLTLLDLDDFKNFNKRQGKLAGDSVLRNVGRTIKKTVRKIDTPFREGGEELAVITPYVTNDQTASTDKAPTHQAERLRKNIRTAKTPEGYSVAASVGTTDYIKGEKLIDFYARADRARRMAKARGKNRTVRTRVVDGKLIADDLTAGQSFTVGISINESGEETFVFTPLAPAA